MTDEALLVSRTWRAWTWLERSTIGLPVALFVFDLVGTAGAAGSWNHSAGDASARPLDGFAWAMVAAGPVALHFRHWFPRTVLVVVFGATLVYFARGYAQGPIWLNVIVAVASAIGNGQRIAAWICSLLFAFGIVFVPPHYGVHVTGIVGTVGWLLAVTMIPELARVLRQRAREAQVIRAEEARRRAGEERLAIARELHDVLAHSISLIAIQANVALEVMDRKPEQARIALTAIKDVSKTALGEVRSVLDVLRGTESAPREPARGLGQVPELAEQTRSAGLRVQLQIDGVGADTVPVAVGQAVYRIVQEALTNVVRHSGSSHARVVITRSGNDLVLSVRNGQAGGKAHAGGSGNGIPGMRERAEALGGRLEARPTPGGGFRVDATIPIHARPSVRKIP